MSISTELIDKYKLLIKEKKKLLSFKFKKELV